MIEDICGRGIELAIALWFIALMMGLSSFVVLTMFLSLCANYTGEDK